MSTACGQPDGRFSRHVADGQPAGPDGCRIPALSCLWCGVPLPPPTRRTTHPRKFCGNVCRSKAFHNQRVQAVRRLTSLLQSLSTTLFATHMAVADVCLHLDTLFLPRRAHGASSNFPAALSESLESARTEISRVLDSLSEEARQAEERDPLREADGGGAGATRGGDGEPEAVGLLVDDARHGAGVHPLGDHVAESAPVGGRSVSGDPTPAGAPHVAGDGERTGVGE